MVLCLSLTLLIHLPLIMSLSLLPPPPQLDPACDMLPKRTLGVLHFGESLATHLLIALDLQLLHSLCDGPFQKDIDTSSRSKAHWALVRFDSDSDTVSTRNTSDSSASTEVSIPRKLRRLKSP